MTAVAPTPIASRPYPARRRASAAATSPLVIRTPAGTPSQIATSARPCDSPAVSHRNMLFTLQSARPGAVRRSHCADAPIPGDISTTWE